MNECNFTLTHYAECLELAIEKGYSFITFDQLIDHKPKEPFIVLRHDVDQHMEPVLWMSAIEEKIGVRANYFFRVHARYNLGFKTNLLIIEAIQEANHLIGLHYDPFFNALDNDTRILKQFINDDTSMFKTTHDPERNIPHKHSKALLFVDHRDLEEHNLKYISDSSHNWRDETFCQAVEKGIPRLYILTHPMWWYIESSVENY